jgi:hypothetical protein
MSNRTHRRGVERDPEDVEVSPDALQDETDRESHA